MKNRFRIMITQGFTLFVILYSQQANAGHISRCRDKILNNLYARIQELSKPKSELIGVMNSRRNIAKDRSREMA
jgi:hypothetical protein